MDSFIKDLILNRATQTPLITFLFVVIVIWSFLWKGLALWHGAKAGEKYWFVAILLLNTVGILEIAYLFYFSKQKQDLQDVIKTIKSFYPARSKGK